MWKVHISDPKVPMMALWRRPVTMAAVCAPFVVMALLACLIRPFSFLYLIPMALGFMFGAVVTQALRAGTHEDNTGKWHRRENPGMFWFGVAWYGAGYLLMLYAVIGIAFMLVREDQKPVGQKSGSSSSVLSVEFQS